MRSKDLPNGGWGTWSEQKRPLKDIATGPKSIGNDVTTYRRWPDSTILRPVTPSMQVGFHSRRGLSMVTSYRFALFHKMFTIPKKIARQWKLELRSQINVEWQCSDGRHPHAFAPMATENDDGRRVAIRAFTNVEGIDHEHCIVRNAPGAVRLSNTLHDFLKGMIVRKAYKWDKSRDYVFSIDQRQENEDSKDPCR